MNGTLNVEDGRFVLRFEFRPRKTGAGWPRRWLTR